MKNIFRLFFGLIILYLFVSYPLKAEVSNKTLSILVNANDPESVKIARYYQKVRLIPDANVIFLKFKHNVGSLTVAEFNKIKIQIKEKTKENIQAYVLAWRKPWKVDCMSITSAISLGYSTQYCAKGCKLTKQHKYFNSRSRAPYTDYKIRPAMMLSATSVENVKKLIDRGKAADFSRPLGAAYLLSTSNKARNVRSVYYPAIKEKFDNLLNVELIKADAIMHKNDVMFYFTGLKKVRWVDKNKFMPGAVADHLTSTGGHLFKAQQMSVLKWIDAGVTGTYGTVVEPCNFVQKFSNPGILMKKYLTGETLLESYWKSVQMPGQGVFVGEPLSSPYKGCNLFENKRGVFQYFENKRKNFVERKSGNCNLMILNKGKGN